MLPERLSNGLCSLRPLEDKLCFSAVFDLDRNGHVLNEWFGRTVIHSDHRFTYEEAQAIIEWKKSEGEELDITNFDIGGVGSQFRYAEFISKISDAVKALDKTAKNMRAKRFKRGSISFDKHEVKFELDENGKPIGLKFKIQKDANKLIEEYMLLANRRVAQFLKKKGPCVNRAHEEPNAEKLEALKEFIAPMGYTIKTTSPEEITRTLNQLLQDVRGTAMENMIGNLVVRTMQKANYTTENIGHYGLGFADYSHFTSPIRRYPDVITHRLLGRALSGKEAMKPSKLEARCKHCSEREIKAQKASRDSVKYKQCEYMAERVGKVYKGMVNSVQDYGIFVEIAENKCEGLVRMSEIGGDVFSADLMNHQVVGYNTGEVIKLGDEVNIVVKSVDIERKNINLTLIRL
jgi:ribonuclease R/exosome complex exonuclease DIS3/RRP44